jgi:hypothetical protein
MATPTSTTLSSLTTSTSTATASCVTFTPGLHGYVPPEACNAQWSYSPSITAAIVFAVLFGLLFVAHFALAISHRKGFCWVIVMASAWEFTAFILRTLGAHNQQQQTIAIASQLFFLLAPLWINAFVYMVVGRLVYTYHPNRRVWGFKAMSLGKYFVWLDIVSFLVQATGGLMLNPSSSATTQKIGKNVYMGGVGLQQLFILVFLTLLVRFHLDASKLHKDGLLSTPSGVKSRSMWKWLTYALYTVLALITMRIVFRLAEYSGGVDPDKNKLPFQEGYQYGLDAAPMMVALFILVVVHPGLALKGPESEFPSRKEKKAEKKAVKAEKKRVKQAKKMGIAVDTPVKGARVSESGMELMDGDVEMGYTGGRR